MAQVYKYAMPSAVAGMLTRGVAPGNATVEQKMLDATTNTPVNFGTPVKLVNNKLQQMTTGDAAAALYGFTVREWPQLGSLTTVYNNLGAAVMNTAQPQSVLKRGYIGVFLPNFAVNPATSASPVFIRVGGAAANKPLGAVESVADGGNTIAITNAYFTGPSDANGFAELAYNI